MYRASQGCVVMTMLWHSLLETAAMPQNANQHGAAANQAQWSNTAARQTPTYAFRVGIAFGRTVSGIVDIGKRLDWRTALVSACAGKRSTSCRHALCSGRRGR